MSIITIHIFFFFFVSFLCFYSVLADVETTNNGIDWWCSTTPHPGPCTYFMAQLTPKSREEFRTMTIQAALDRAVDAHGQANSIGSRCRSKRKTIVNRDCNNLIENTILQLNTTLQSIQTNASFTNFDVQTWLSTALTNIEICRSGSRDLNVTKFSSPILSGNVSELISNSLATNGGLLDNSSSSYHTGDDNGYPAWVSGRDRELLQDLELASRANVIVAKDGSGKFRSIQAAINYATARRVGNGRVVVYVKRGVYRENILISRTMNKVMLVGDGLRYTVITGSRSVSSGFTTYSSATVGIDGIGFIARGITFRNTAGPQNGQAVALRSASDLSVFYACGFEGYQDTLFVHAQRQFYKACYIYGTIDFIFGNAAVVFQNCIIYVRRPLVGQANVITAQGRGDPFQNTGISIHNSRVMPAPDLKPVVRSFKTYLGRPWQQYSRTVIMKSYLDSLVSPEGWSRWEDSDFALSTLYYGEYQNFGPGGSTRNRVKWPGYHVIRSTNVANRFTVANLIAGRAWLPSTGVPFTAGL
ncbi:UNVERIFIED_CONTAM: putative pectinesterase/pectinesterase inhibitor 60 [Sesamum latifolium]|uniref:Pectinesterase n=1 Tax=Sesamum latifolium TaxID=2727402 RepID=A0AAW2XIC8_9LAMI